MTKCEELERHIMELRTEEDALLAQIAEHPDIMAMRVRLGVAQKRRRLCEKLLEMPRGEMTGGVTE